MTTQQAKFSAVKNNPNDERYTPIHELEREIPYYKNHLRGKRVHLPADNESSAFWRYFVDHFDDLGLQALSSSIIGQDYSLHYHPLIGAWKQDGGGDMLGPAGLSLIAAADVVVTNPPFSLLRRLFGVLGDTNKGFLLIAPQTSMAYQSVFPHLQSGRWVMGVHRPDGPYSTPSGRLFNDPNIWLTNLQHGQPRPALQLTESYHPDRYPEYANYPAIEVPKYKLIPKDYEGIMGVPISYLRYGYCPEQFELLGTDSRRPTPEMERLDVAPYKDGSPHGTPKMGDLLLQIPGPLRGKVYYQDAQGRYFKVPFRRVFIRRVATPRT